MKENKLHATLKAQMRRWGDRSCGYLAPKYTNTPSLTRNAEVAQTDFLASSRVPEARESCNDVDVSLHTKVVTLKTVSHTLKCNT